MSTEPQEGIYYRSKPPIGNSLCILSLRSESTSHMSKIGNAVGLIWKHLEHLKRGTTVDLDIDRKHRKIGNLSVLVAYGSSLFSALGSQKKKPQSFDDSWNFKVPLASGGGPILEGSGLNYSMTTFNNHLLADDIIFQFIADNEFYTKRATVEVWKALYKLQKTGDGVPLRLTGIYNGFQRADRRNWLGFHDGVSNIRSRERPYVIFINSNRLPLEDKWTLRGTYIAFMRIAFDIAKWEDTQLAEQEILIGREKSTGCPLVKVDKNNRPIKDPRCPITGTSEVIDPGNENFREHPPYQIGKYDNVLRYSHIGRTRPVDRVPIIDTKSLRIYRQGFEFLIPSNDNHGIVAGLNFISFQNTPSRLFRALTYRYPHPDPLTSTNVPNLDQFMSVLAAGYFFVPSVANDEPFPGAGIFFNKIEMRNLIRKLGNAR